LIDPHLNRIGVFQELISCNSELIDLQSIEFLDMNMGLLSSGKISWYMAELVEQSFGVVFYIVVCTNL
jgi:hypothetical protein